MNPEFLMLIFNPPFSVMDLDKKRQKAKELGYTMFAHNGTVYDVNCEPKLFELSDLIIKIK